MAAGRTQHFGLNRTGVGQSLADEGHKHTTTDRDVIDRYLWIGAQEHRHTGTDVSFEEPATGPDLDLQLTGGSLGPGLRVFYKYSYINLRGEESKASPEEYVDTPDAVVEPSAPSFTVTSTGGSLGLGTYTYVLTAFSTSSNYETKAINQASTTLATGTSTNVIRVTMPSYPAGAIGFNLYRRAPNESSLVYLATIDTPDTYYDDDGTVTPNRNRTLPKKNTTNGQNAVVVSMPGATPSVPDGYTWRLYRTVVEGDYSVSRLADITEYNVEFDPESGILASYTDLGAATSTGEPLSASLYVNNPEKIILTDGAQVQGELPPSQINAYPVVDHMAFAGILEETDGTFIWFCEYDQAKIRGFRPVLGVDSIAGFNDVILDVQKGSGQSPSFTTIFSVNDPPTVAQGDSYGVLAVPDDVDLVLGDQLKFNIVQADGGATPSAADLVVDIVLWVKSDQSTNIDWS